MPRRDEQQRSMLELRKQRDQSLMRLPSQRQSVETLNSYESNKYSVPLRKMSIDKQL